MGEFEEGFVPRRDKGEEQDKPHECPNVDAEVRVATLQRDLLDALGERQEALCQIEDLKHIIRILVKEF